MSKQELEDQISFALNLKLNMVDFAKITCHLGGVSESKFLSALKRVTKRRK